MAVAYSITASGRYEPFGLQVSRGQIMGHRAVTVFGYNADVDTSEETIWTGGGILAHPAAAGCSRSVQAQRMTQRREQALGPSF